MYLKEGAVLINLGVSWIAASHPTATRWRALSWRWPCATGFLMAVPSSSASVYWLSFRATVVASAVARAGVAPVQVVGPCRPAWLRGATLLSALRLSEPEFVSAAAQRWISGVGATTLVGFGGYFQCREGRSDEVVRRLRSDERTCGSQRGSGAVSAVRLSTRRLAPCRA